MRVRLLGILIACSVLATQAFAGQEIGRQATRAILNNGAAIQNLANTYGVLPAAINSSNVAKLSQSKQLIGKVRNAIIAGVFTGMLLVPGLATADSATKKINEIDKAAKSVKVDAAAEREFRQVVGLSGSFLSSTKKDDSLLVGANYSANYKYKLSSFNAKLSGVLNNVKRTGSDDWMRHNDYVGRANYIQAFDIDGREIMPIFIADGGAAHYGDSRRLADLTGSLGMEINGTYLGRDVYLQIRAGGGGLGQAQYVDGEFPELDWESVVVLGLTAKLPWVTLGDMAGASEGSIAHYIPLIPGGDLEYSRFYKASDFDIATDVLRASLALTKELSLKGEYNKRTGEPSHHTVQLNLELTDIFAAQQ